MTYKGYCSSVQYTEADNMYSGRLFRCDGKKMTDLVIWVSCTWEGIEKSFCEAVDDYLEFLKVVENETY